MIIKGHITKTDGKFATVMAEQGEIYDDVLLLYTYGSQSKVKPSDSTLVLLLGCSNSKSNLFGIPYDILTQLELEEGDSEVRNRVSGNGFKAGLDKNDVTGDVDCDKTINATSYKVDNVQVVGSQQPSITNPTGGAIIDAESRVAIASIIAALQAHGLIL